MEFDKKITITLNDDTIKFLESLLVYENMKRNIKTGKMFITLEDIIKAALSDYIDNIQNYYKKNIVESKDHLIQPITLKNRFKLIMEEKGLKQKDLSELTGIDKANLSNILNNKNQPGSDYFLRLWVSLDYPKIENIFYREE